MKKDPVIEVLRLVPGLHNSNDKSLGRLVRLMDRAKVGAGHILTRQGAYESQAYIVVAGKATVEIDGIEVNQVGPGEIIGEMALIDGGPRTATVRATTEMELLVIGRATFSDFMHGEDVGSAIAEQLSHRLRAADERSRQPS